MKKSLDYRAEQFASLRAPKIIGRKTDVPQKGPCQEYGEMRSQDYYASAGPVVMGDDVRVWDSQLRCYVLVNVVQEEVRRQIVNYRDEAVNHHRGGSI